MPLSKKRGKKAISDNIKRLMDEGHSQKQSIAIAYSVAGRARKRKRK
jgi:hypothetical protein